MSLDNKTKQELINEINELKKQLRKKVLLSETNKQNKEVQPDKFGKLPFCYCLFDEKQVYYINQETINLLKLPKTILNDLSKLNIYQFILEEYQPMIKKINKQIMAGKIFNGVEFKCRDWKGNIIDVESQSRPVVYKGKKVQQAFFKDVTEKNIVQSELLKTKENFEEIISKIDEVVFYYNKIEKRIEFISNQLYELVGIKASDYIKNPSLSIELAHPDDLPNLYKANEQLNKKKLPQNIQYRIFHKKKKKYIWIDEKIFPQFDSKGNHIANLGISRDVTDQINQKEQLKLSEEKFRLLAENASDIIFSYMFKPYPHYSYISPSMEKILGYPLKNFYNDPYFGFKITHPDDKNKPAVKETVKTLKENLDKFENVDNAQVVRFIAKNGKTIWLETRYTQIKDGETHIGQEGISRDITAQKEAELELAEKERTIRNLFNNLPGMAYRCLNDKHWTMQFLSDGCYELTGFKPADLINNKNKSYSDIVHPEDRLLGKDDIYFAIKNRTAFEIEYRILSKHKKEIWVWEKGEGIYDESGKLLYIEGFITDISERKKIETELNQKWLEYKNMVDDMPVGVFIHENGKIVFANKPARKLVGAHSNEDPSNINFFDYLDDKQKLIAEQRVIKQMKGEQLPPIIYNIVNKDGVKLKLRVFSNPIIFKGKRAAQIILQDISKEEELEQERKRSLLAEQINQKLQEEINQRKQTEEELNKTKNYLQSIIDSSLDIISASDKNGHIIEFNKAALKAFGYELNEVLGKSADFMFSNKTNQAKAVAELIKTGVYKGEVINRRKNGEEFTSYLSASVLKNEKGEIIGTMGISRDITFEKERERLLKEKQDQIIQQSLRLNAIFESSSHLVWTINRNYEVTTFNTNFAEVLRYKYGILIKLNDRIHERIPEQQQKEYFDFWKPLYDSAFAGQSLIKERFDKEGKEAYRLIYLNPIYNSKNEVVEISCLANDITDIKNYERQILEQSSKLKAIFENGNQLFWTINKDRQLVTFNQKYSEAINSLYGFYPEVGKQLQEAADKSINYEYVDFWGEKYDEVFKNKKTINFVTERVSTENKTIYRQIFLYPIFDNNNEIIEIGGMGMDITDLKYYQEKTIEQASKLNAIIDNSHHKIWSINRNFELTSINKNYELFIESVFGIKPKIGDAMNKPPFISTAENNNHFASNALKVIEGKTVEFMYSVVNKKGEKQWMETFLSPIFNKDGDVVEISAIANDITLRKTMEDEKNRQAALIKAIFDSSSYLIFTVNKEYKITSFNKNYYNYAKEYYGQDIEIGKSLFDGIHNNMPQMFKDWRALHDSVMAGKPLYYQNMAQKPNGEAAYFETFLDPVYLPGGEIEEVSYISLDITEKFLAQEQLKSSLKEKEVLLKEVHHRVKNNLQVISSILNLQSTYIRDEKTIYILRECQNRIKSMAYIHEALYQNKNFSEIPFNEYLVMLVKNLFQTYNIENNNIKLNFEIDEVFLNLDTSIPCGLIVNELVSNSFKYAFPDKKQGFIFISLKSKNNDVSLIIKDNGVGLPNEIDFKNTESLGLQLVVTLVEQIGGRITLDNSNGTKFEINFKQTEKHV